VRTDYTTASSYPDASKFEIVFGCFSVHANAKKLVRQLNARNIRASISPERHKGMDVVVCGGFTEKEQALQALGSLREVMPDAWIKSR
jgi:cell division septation protein DedD